MPKDVSALKKEFENIQVPQELDLYIEQAIRKGRRGKTTGRIFKPLVAVISLVLVFALSVNLSPAFASYVSNMGMESLVNIFSFDQGLANVVEKGFGDVNDASVTDQGITLTVESAIYDGRRLVIAVKTESDRELNYVWLEDVHISGFFGTSWANHNFRNVKNVFYQFLECNIDDAQQLQGMLVIECTKIDIAYPTDDDHLPEISETLRGNWTIPINVDTALAKYEPKHLAVNKVVSIDEMQFTVKCIEIYPTVIDMKISLGQNNPARFTSFKNPRLIDTDGNEYRYKFSSKRGTDLNLSFESTYFTGTTDLTFAFDGVYTLPLEETYFIIDIENECVLDDGGLGIEYVKHYEDERYLDVLFKLTDREYEEADEQFLWIDYTVYDLLGNPYDVILRQWHPLGQSIQYSLGFDVDQGIPSAVKVEVTGISKGIMKLVRVKLITE